MGILGGSAFVVGPLLLAAPLAAKQDAASLLERANRLIEQQRFVEALEVLDRCVADDDSSAKLHVSRAFVMNRLGDHVRAVEDASRAIELDPRDLGGFYERAFGLYRQKEFVRALADYDRAIALAPRIAALHGERGDLLREMDALGDAVASYDAALALSPSWVEAYTGRALALNGLTDYAAARRDLCRATELAPDAPALWQVRAFSEAQCGDDAAALRSADEFVRLQPEEWRAWAAGQAAFVAWDAGELERAAELFERAAQAEPPNPELVLCLGYVQLARGDFEAATTTLDSAARLGDPRQLGRARMMRWCIDARALGLAEAGQKLEERLGERIEGLSAVERALVGFCRTGDESLVLGELFPSEVCALSFLAAWRCDVAGDGAAAERWLRRCLNTGSFDSKEWKNALLWLRTRQPGLRTVLGAELEWTESAGGAGVRVRAVAPGSASDLQGLRAGDELLDLRGRPLAREEWDALEGGGRIGLALRVTRRGADKADVLRIRLGVAPGG